MTNFILSNNLPHTHTPPEFLLNYQLCKGQKPKQLLMQNNKIGIIIDAASVPKPKSQAGWSTGPQPLNKVKAKNYISYYHRYNVFLILCLRLQDLYNSLVTDIHVCESCGTPVPASQSVSVIHVDSLNLKKKQFLFNAYLMHLRHKAANIIFY